PLPRARGQVHFALRENSVAIDAAPGLVTERFTVRPADNFPVNRHIKSIVRLHRVQAVGPYPHHFQCAMPHLRGIGPGNRGSTVLPPPPLAAAHPSLPYEIPAGMPAPD